MNRFDLHIGALDIPFVTDMMSSLAGHSNDAGVGVAVMAEREQREILLPLARSIQRGDGLDTGSIPDEIRTRGLYRNATERVFISRPKIFTRHKQIVGRNKFYQIDIQLIQRLFPKNEQHETHIHFFMVPAVDYLHGLLTRERLPALAVEPTSLHLSWFDCIEVLIRNISPRQLHIWDLEDPIAAGERFALEVFGIERFDPSGLLPEPYTSEDVDYFGNAEWLAYHDELYHKNLDELEALAATYPVQVFRST